MMKNRTKQNSILKYAVLKPNQLLASLKGKFRPPSAESGFEVAQEGGVGVRRYRVTLESLERFVQDCQWRLEQTGPVVRCLFLDLTPSPSSSRLSIEVYVEHLELPLSKMQGLISPEAFYLVQRSLEGFRVLWEKTGAVGLSDEAIGLDFQGDCRVWLNRQLSLNYPQDPPCSKPWEIAQEVLRLVQGRSEPAAHALLARLKDKIATKEFDFKGVGVVLSNFLKKCQMKIPVNLKYLVYQHRLRLKVETLSSISGSRELIRPQRIPSFLPRRESTFTEKPFTPKLKGRKMMAQRHMSALQTSIQSPFRRIAHPSIYSSFRPDDLNASLLETYKRMRISNRLEISVSNHSKESPSRCKSRSFESIGLMNSLAPNHNRCDQNSSTEEISRCKRESNYSDNSLTKVSIMSRSKLSNCSIYDLATTAKRLHSKCSYIQTPFHQLSDLKSETQSQSGECSSQILEEPTTPKLHIREEVEEGPTFHQIPEAEQIILANKWTTTLRNLEQHETKMNTSIVYGRDTSVYLADVRLEKLETLTSNLVASLSSRGSEVM